VSPGSGNRAGDATVPRGRRIRCAEEKIRNRISDLNRTAPDEKSGFFVFRPYAGDGKDIERGVRELAR